MDLDNIREPQMGLTFEKVWALFQETGLKMQETDRVIKETGLKLQETERVIKEMSRETDLKMRETDRIIKEMGRETGLKLQETERVIKEMSRETDLKMRETDRQMKEMVKETDRQMKETDRKIGKLGNKLGDLVEHIIAPNLLEKFNKAGFHFWKIAPNVIFKKPNGDFIAEVDLLLEDSGTLLPVEIKTTLTVTDVREHAERMKKLRDYADEQGDKRRFVGAVGGAIIPEGVKEFAYGSGFYVIEQSGDTVKIDVPKGFVPKEW